jgi:choline transport protein
VSKLRIKGFDGAVHMSEEVRRAKQAVPRSIFYTVVTNGILAYAMVICMLFTMGSVEEAQKSRFPIIEICQQATGSVKAATAMVSGLLVISLSVNLASIASVSRLTWAWARDGALPRWFAYVGLTRTVSQKMTLRIFADRNGRLTVDIMSLYAPCGSLSSLSWYWPV